MWQSAGSVEDYSEDEPSTVSVGGKQIAVYLIEGAFYATAALCSHGRALLSDGYLEGEEIECPLHQGRFHIPTGRALCKPLTEDIATFDTKVEESILYVKIPEDPA
jgi:naphthalene 1,2-dioxygenase system ferredoxin subunit